MAPDLILIKNLARQYQGCKSLGLKKTLLLSQENLRKNCIANQVVVTR